jgi:Ca2+-binding EF-hand superfamily protein
VTRKNEGYKRKVFDRKDFEDNDKLSFSVINGIIQILLKEFSLIEELERIADELMNSKDFTTYEAFLCVDLDNQRYLSESSVMEFLQRHGYNITRNDAEDIVFRIDSDGDGRVSYKEFQEIFLPFRISKKENFNPYGESTFYNTYSYRFKNTGDTVGATNLDKFEVIDDLNAKQSRNRKISHEDLSDYKVNGETSYFKKKSTNDIFNGKDKLNLTHLYVAERDVEDLKNPEQNLESSLDENLTQANEKFYTTLSTIKKGFLSTFRSTVTDDINIRLSRNTYTSPIRIKDYTYDKDYMEKSSITTPYLKDINNFSPSRFPRQILHPKADFEINRQNIINREIFKRNVSPYSHKYVTLSPTRFRNFNNDLTKRFKEENESKLLARFMEDLVRLDNAAESLREDLTLSTDNSLQEIFAFFDDFDRRKISPVDFVEKLRELNVFTGLSEIKLLFRRYDADDDGRLK